MRDMADGEEMVRVKDGWLYRFTNRAGVPYSAILQGGYEVASCMREGEEQMVAWWEAIKHYDFGPLHGE